MLTSAGQREDVSRCQRLGISQYLTKPIKQSELFDAIINAIGQPSEERSQVPPRDKIAPSAGRSLKVLIAEDNQVNQLLAKRIFEKLGHEVMVVSNGREAVAAVQGRKFDVIAMDVQMPEMDGLEATNAIRAWEKTTGTYTPIIAMTAHAMKGDRERCLQAGMDGYASKPFRIRDIEDVIDQLMRSARSTQLAAPVPDQDGATIDEDALLQGIEGDRQLLGELIRLFLADYPQLLVEIKQAIRRSDAEALAKASHALKGSVGNFAARKAFAAAQAMENVGKCGELSTANEAYRTLESELSLLGEELRKLVSGSSLGTQADKGW